MPTARRWSDAMETRAGKPLGDVARGDFLANSFETEFF
jgi:hypothetical protein